MPAPDPRQCPKAATGRHARPRPGLLPATALWRPRTLRPASLLPPPRALAALASHREAPSPPSWITRNQRCFFYDAGQPPPVPQVARQVTNTLAEPILGGLLVSVGI